MRLTLRSAIFVLILFLVMVPTAIITRYLVSQFEQIQENEQVQNLETQAESITQQISFDLALFQSQLDQITQDSVTTLAAYTGTFAERARKKMENLAQQHDIVSALLLVNKKQWTMSTAPLQAELIDFTSIAPIYKNLYSQSIQARSQFHIIDAPKLAQEIRTRIPKTNLGIASSKILMIVHPLILSDTRYADEFSVFAGALVALIPLENIYAKLDRNNKNIHLAALSMDQHKIESSRTFAPQSFIDVNSTFSIDGFSADLNAIFVRSRAKAFQAVDQLTEKFLWIIAISIILLGCLAILASRWLIKPITTVNNIVKRYLTRDYTPTKLEVRFTEVQNIIDVLAQMSSQIQEDQDELENRVKARTHELEEANEELSTAMEKLKIAQDQLIEKEKLSLLGQLVAGIAHEINTPLGICVTAGTSLELDLNQLKTAYDNNAITRKALEKFICDFQDGFAIILNNINRSATLIQNFKAVAVDSSSEQERVFNLKQYIEETVHSLRPELRKFDTTVEIEGSNNLVLKSYPGAYAQILTNLIMNSLRHGFSQGSKHHINIRFLAEDSTLNLCYRDDGSGVDAVQLEKLFEPFYTTLSSQGGSGLGLNIIHNLVTSTLNGTIKVESELGKGIEFTLTLPLIESSSNIDPLAKSASN